MMRTDGTDGARHDLGPMTRTDGARHDLGEGV